MADLLARLDPTTDYVYVTSADEYPVPNDVWRWLLGEPFAADYSAAHRGELRLSRAAGVAAVKALVEAGHNVTTTTGVRSATRPPRAPRALQECQVCGQPYAAGTVAVPGAQCSNLARVRDPETGEMVAAYPPHELQLGGPPT